MTNSSYICLLLLLTTIIANRGEAYSVGTTIDFYASPSGGTGEVSDIWVNESGDTMTGTLIGTNITADNFTGKFYGDGSEITGVSATVADIWVNETGDTMTGGLISPNLTATTNLKLETGAINLTASVGTAWTVPYAKIKSYGSGGVLLYESDATLTSFLLHLSDSKYCQIGQDNNRGYIDATNYFDFMVSGDSIHNLRFITTASVPELISIGALGKLTNFNTITSSTGTISFDNENLTTSSYFLGNGSRLTDISHTDLKNIGTNTHAQIDTHIANVANPHSVTASQVGLGNVDNLHQIDKAIGTTKGDIVAYTASNSPSRLGVGANTYVLTADSAEATGMKWAAAAAGSTVGYTMQGSAGNQATMTDSQTMYWGDIQLAPTTTQGNTRIYIPKTGTLKVAYVFVHCATAGTAESWTMYFRLNAATDTTIQALGLSSSQRVWSNTGLSTAVTQGNYFEIKEVQPAWVTNPANCRRSFSLYIE